jgi:DNA-binding NarL/FixJ family response regulator
MSISVYIADDHELVRDGLKALLEDYPEILVVGDSASGTQAVSDALRLQPEVVILDINMPELNGIDAARQILEAAPTTRVIILSMLGTPEHVFRALQAGACGYLLKESASREVIDAVTAVAGGKMYFSQPVTTTLVNDYVNIRASNAIQSPISCLSQREREILIYVIEGKSSAEIGHQLHLSRKTIESYRSRMMQKLGIEDMPALIRFAMHEGLIT